MNYDEMLDLPHFHDPKQPYMSLSERAAQFAPYKALVGYDQMITESGGVVERKPLIKVEYDEDRKA